MEPLRVGASEAGQKLLNFLQRRVDAPQGDIQRWIRTGQVRRNKSRAKPFERVDAGDEIRVPPFASLKSAVPGVVAFPFPDAVFENDSLLVVNKRAGLPVQGGTGHTDSLAARMVAHYQGAGFVPAPAHRLDKDTSGLVLAGKTYATQRYLSDLFAGHEDSGTGFAKDYLAWVWGDWPAKKGEAVRLEDYLRKDEAGQAVTRVQNPEEGRRAVSLAVLAGRRDIAGQPVSLLLLRLLTGRTHQLRVQLAGRGFPLVGDPKYGDSDRDARKGVSGLKLHAARLALPEGQVFTALPVWPAPWSVDVLPEADFALQRVQ